MGIINAQLNREDREGSLVDMKEDDWVKVASAMALHQQMVSLTSSGSSDRKEPPIDSEAVWDVSESLQQAERAQEIIFQSQFEDLRFSETADDVFDGGIKEGASLLIRVVPESQNLDGAWHKVSRNWMNQTDGVPTKLTFDKFSVQSINEPDQERYQIVQTFGGDILYGFGRQPRIMMLTGNVINGKVNVRVNGNTRSMDWKNALQRNYADHYRLTQCIHNRQKILIYAEHTIYSGYLLNMQTFTSAETQSMSQVTMSFIIDERQFGIQNDDTIPGRLNEEGRAVTDKDVPDKYLKDANVDNYIDENLVPLVKNIKNETDKESDDIANELARLTGKSSEEAYKKRAKNAEGYYQAFQNIKVHKLFQDTSFPDFKTLKLKYRIVNKKMYEFVKKYGNPPPNSDVSDFDNVSSFLEKENVSTQIALTEDYQRAKQSADSKKANQDLNLIEGQKVLIQKYENSLEKKIQKANNLAERLVDNRIDASKNEVYIQALQ